MQSGTVNNAWKQTLFLSYCRLKITPALGYRLHAKPFLLRITCLLLGATKETGGSVHIPNYHWDGSRKWEIQSLIVKTFILIWFSLVRFLFAGQYSRNLFVILWYCAPDKSIFTTYNGVQERNVFSRVCQSVCLFFYIEVPSSEAQTWPNLFIWGRPGPVPLSCACSKLFTFSPYIYRQAGGWPWLKNLLVHNRSMVSSE